METTTANGQSAERGTTKGTGSPRLRLLGLLCLACGGLGVLLGVIGASTFLAMPDLLPAEFAGLRMPLVALSVAGLLASAVAVVAGRRLMTGRTSAWRLVLLAAGSAIVIVAVMSALYPVSDFLAFTAIPVWAVLLILVYLARDLGGAATTRAG